MRLHRLCAILCVLCASAVNSSAIDDYQLGPDSQRQDGVPQGKVTKLEWKDSKVFPNTTRDWWTYVPAQYDGQRPACVMVFQDGGSYANDKGQFRVPVVFDNLIHKKEMPVTIAILINPGNDPTKNPPPRPGEQPRAGARPRGPSNRSFEYDTLSDAYARFLMDEILPEVAKTYKLSDRPEDRAICGSSSGGICAFTVAWERPDAFRKVVSHIGSFTSIAYRPARDGQPMRPGGDLYPALIRKNPIKPLRIFLQDGSNDLNNDHGNWFLANQQMLSALEYANAKADKAKSEGPRYDVKHAWVDGAHSGKHGGAILPDTLRWLWRDHAGK
jgi:enterochelin esterase family protein